MVDEEPNKVEPVIRQAYGPALSSLLANEIAIMQALALLSELKGDKAYDTQQALRYRISETTKLLTTPTSTGQASS